MKDIYSNTNFLGFLILWNHLQRQTTPVIHLDLALWMERRWEAGDRQLLIMAFRGFGKSTIVGVFCTWLLWRNPDLRILVLAADMALACKMVRNVKRIVEKHPFTQNLKPDVPDQWGSDRFTLTRSKELRDPSMLAKGITTNLTGTRADLIICDDVEVAKTCDTAEKRETLRERLLELDYILTPDGTQLYIGTPHHWNTIYADRVREGEERIFLSDFLRITIPVQDENGISTWPERFPPEKIEQNLIKSGPRNFAAHMLCQPVNMKDGKFDTDNLQIYDDNVVYSESGQQPVLTIGGHRMTNAVAYWDPAFGRQKGDKSVIAILYSDDNGSYWLHHLQAITSTPDGSLSELVQQCRKAIVLLEQYFVPVIAVETNGIGQFLPGVLKREIGDAGLACPIIQVTNRTPKNVRITKSLDAVLANRSLNIHRTALHNSFLRELQDWSPHKKNQADDALDAVAGALEMTPIRISRSLGTKTQKWQGNAKIRIAKTLLD